MPSRQEPGATAGLGRTSMRGRRWLCGAAGSHPAQPVCSVALAGVPRNTSVGATPSDQAIIVASGG